MQKTYIVVGGSTGIGLALTRSLSMAGHRILVYSRTAEQLAGLSGVEHIALDVVQQDFPTESLPAQVHGLAYCPGSINLRAFSSLKPESFREDLEINLLGAVKSIQAALKALKNTPDSSIVLFSTVAVGLGMPFHASVSAAKGAIEGLTRSLAAELAPNIRVNCIAPSLTDTPLAARLLNSDDKREASAARHPLKKVGSPEEIAALAKFLLSDDAAWITGQVMHQDGGMSAVKV